MNVTLTPGARSGQIRIPASKSQAHRLLICAALGDAPVRLQLDGRSKDIDATIGCLRALGAEIACADGLLEIIPMRGLCSVWRGGSRSARLHRWTRSLRRTV